jgi:hypothetical protein
VKSTVGRPRRVTDAQIRIILAWRAELVELKAARKAVRTTRQLARELQLSTATISDVIRRHGLFKQPSPEQREATLRHRQATLRRLRNMQQRVPGLSASQFAAVVRWWRDKQATEKRLSGKKVQQPRGSDARIFAEQLGIKLALLRRALAELNRRR